MKTNFDVTLKSKGMLLSKITIFSFFLLLLLGCSKDNLSNDSNVSLPPETQVGANTFGCYANGKLIVPRGYGAYNGNYPAVLWGDPAGTINYYELDIMDLKSEKGGKIFIHMQGIHQLGIGTYVIDESNGQTSIDGYAHNYMHGRIFKEQTNSFQYYRSYPNSGILKITRYDFTNRIISGTFSGRLRNTVDAADEIEITQGRFDIKWSTLLTTNFP